MQRVGMLANNDCVISSCAVFSLFPFLCRGKCIISVVTDAHDRYTVFFFDVKDKFFDDRIIDNVVTAGDAFVCTDKFVIIDLLFDALFVDLVRRDKGKDICHDAAVILRYHCHSAVVCRHGKVNAQIYFLSFPFEVLCAALLDEFKRNKGRCFDTLIDDVAVLREEVFSCGFDFDRICPLLF